MSRVYKIGRDERNDIVLDFPSIDDFHAEVFVDPEKNCFFTDLNTTHGSKLNGKKLSEPVLLQANDQLSLGVGQYFDWELVFFNRKTQSTPKPKEEIRPVEKEKKSSNSIPEESTKKGFLQRNIDLIIIFGAILFLIILLGAIG